MRSLTLLALLSLGLSACAQSPDLTVEIDEFVSDVNEARGGICMCPQDAGFESMAECAEVVELLSVGETNCIAAVLENQGDAGADYLACLTSAYSDAAACLTANVNCEDGQLQACEQARETAVTTCSQLPASEQLALDACIGA